MSYQLILGNKAYSSWSLRGYLLFEAFGIPYDQQIVPLYTDAFEDFKQRTFPAQQVPTLVVTNDDQIFTIWDSLSIAEYLSEQHPEIDIWPADSAARAAARSLCAEMHASFMSLRKTMPMNLRRLYSTFQPDEDTKSDIARVCALWAWAKNQWGQGGPYLFGTHFSAADAFYAPVAARFKTYDISVDTLSQQYVDNLLAHPAIEAFYEDGAKEPWVMAHNELDID